jgi:NTP pyrophosphatase (non-canonical NTP hydrolase)
MKKALNRLRDEIHANAADHGFYQVEEETDRIGVDNRSAIKHAFFAQKIALIHSELSEALEADRENRYADLTGMEEQGYDRIDFHRGGTKTGFECYVKNTVEDELADTIIRVLDLCGHLGIDIERHVKLKMEYNETRKYKHGKNY